MNAAKFYVSACRIVVGSNLDNMRRLQELCNVLPMLRNSVSCTVCERLLIEPYTPEETTCQHHVCKKCLGGLKVLRCSWCKDYSKYSENIQLRLLITSYTKLCALIKVTELYQLLRSSKEHVQRIDGILRESEEYAKGEQAPLDHKTIVIKQEINCSDEEAELVVNHHAGGDVDLNHTQNLSMPSRRRTDCGGDDDNISGADRFRTRRTSERIKRRVSSGGACNDAADGLTDKSGDDAVLPADISIRLEAEEQEDSRPPSSLDEFVLMSPNKVEPMQEDYEDEAPYLGEMAPYVKMDSGVFVKDEGEVEEEEELVTSQPISPISRSEECVSSYNSAGNLVLSNSSSLIGSSSQCRGPTLALTSKRVGRSTPTKATFPSRQSFILQQRPDQVSNSAASALRLNSSSIRNLVSSTPYILSRNNGQKQQSDTKAKEDKNKKTGCRCGNATAAPGKLTCCGQRCPCYVSRLACMDCKCRGCNNPNLPGGGKVLPYLNVALNPEGHGLVKPRSWGSTTYPSVARSQKLTNGSATTDKPTTAVASNVVRVPAANSSDSSRMTDVDINTIPVVNLSSASAYRSLIGASPVVKRLNQNSNSISSTILSTLSATSKPLPSSSSTAQAKPPSSSPATQLRLVSSSSASTSTVRIIPAASLVSTQLRVVSTVSASSSSSSSSSSAGSLSTVTIPLSSLSSGGLKLRPVDQLQKREIKARVIPTSFRLKTTPYARLPSNGKINGQSGAKVQAVSLMSLLKNSQNKHQTLQIRNDDLEGDLNVKH